MRVDTVIGVSYDADLGQVKEILNDIAAKDERVKADPAPMIAVSELADNSVNFAVRPWVNAADYWGVYFDAMENIKKAFDAEGIEIPYPKRDITIKKDEGKA